MTDAAIRRHLYRETAISIAINMVLSAVFFLAVFGRTDPVPVWRGMGLAADMVPQSFMVGLMGALVPSLLTRKRIAAGLLPGAWAPAPSPAAVFGRALSLAIAAVLIGAGGTAALLALSGMTMIPSAVALPLKILFGGIEGAIVTPIALRAIIAAARTA